jgi:hypothetical protein
VFITLFCLGSGEDARDCRCLCQRFYCSRSSGIVRDTGGYRPTGACQCFLTLPTQLQTLLVTTLMSIVYCPQHYLLCASLCAKSDPAPRVCIASIEALRCRSLLREIFLCFSGKLITPSTHQIYMRAKSKHDPEKYNMIHTAHHSDLLRCSKILL